jgi:hypothetical protein
VYPTAQPLAQIKQRWSVGLKILVHPASYPVCIQILPSGPKRPGREANHSPPSRAKGKNLWSYDTETSNDCRLGPTGLLCGEMRRRRKFSPVHWCIKSSDITACTMLFTHHRWHKLLSLKRLSKGNSGHILYLFIRISITLLLSQLYSVGRKP